MANIDQFVFLNILVLLAANTQLGGITEQYNMPI